MARAGWVPGLPSGASGAYELLSPAGTDEPASAQELATQLAAAFGTPMTVTLEYVATRQDGATGNP